MDVNHLLIMCLCFPVAVTCCVASVVTLVGSVVCTLCPLVMDGVNTGVCSGWLSRPNDSNMYVFDDGGGGINNPNNLNIDLKLLITPQYPQVKTKLKNSFSDVFIPSCSPSSFDFIVCFTTYIPLPPFPQSSILSKILPHFSYDC